jgi:cell division protein FtsB
VTSATERFKSLLANALERMCVLEEQLEQAEAEIERLRADTEKEDEHGEPAPAE